MKNPFKVKILLVDDFGRDNLFSIESILSEDEYRAGKSNFRTADALKILLRRMGLQPAVLELDVKN